MKSKPFKLERKTLFVFKNQRDLLQAQNPTGTSDAITLTKTFTYRAQK